MQHSLKNHRLLWIKKNIYQVISKKSVIIKKYKHIDLLALIPFDLKNQIECFKMSMNKLNGKTEIIITYFEGILLKTEKQV